MIENEVAALPRVAGTWCLRGLYGDIDLSQAASHRRSKFPHHDTACAHRAPIRLLKLHGSLNWIIRTRRQDPELGTLIPSLRAREHLVFVHDARQAFHHDARFGGATRPWYVWPLIVPPIYDKQRLFGTALLSEVWDKARKSIEEAERLTLLGYSLPDADVFARQMLRRAFATNPLQRVDCINPDPSVAAKLKAILGCRVVGMYDTVDAYIEHSPP